MWPCTHSSSSRTSRTTASSGSSEAGTVGTCIGITPPSCNGRSPVHCEDGADDHRPAAGPEAVLAAVPLGDLAVAHRRDPRLAVHRGRGGGLPRVRPRRGRAVAAAALAAAGAGRALRRRGDRRAAVRPLPGAPLGGHGRGGLHAHRLADPHLDAGPDRPDPDRRRHPRRAAAAVRAGLDRGADRVVAGHRAGAAPGGRRRRAGRRRPRPPRRAGAGRGDVSGQGRPPRSEAVAAPPVGRRPSPLIVLVHTVTFRQARQFVPAAIGLAAAAGFNGGTPAVVTLVVGVTLVSLATAALSWWRFSYVD